MSAQSPLTSKSLREMKESKLPTSGIVNRRKPRRSQAVSVDRPIHVPLCPIRRALFSIGKTAFTDEKGTPVLDLEVVAAMRGMFPPGKEYMFDMVANTTVGASVTGAILQAIPVSPAIVSYSEYPALAGLFDEIRLVRSQLEFIPLVGSNGSNLNGPGGAVLPTLALACGVDYTALTAAPGAYLSVLRLPASAQIARTSDDLTGKRVFTLSPPISLPFARTATPAVQDPPAGCLGAFMIAGSGTGYTANAVYYAVTLRTVVVLRNRF